MRSALTLLSDPAVAVIVCYVIAGVTVAGWLVWLYDPYVTDLSGAAWVGMMFFLVGAVWPVVLAATVVGAGTHRLLVLTRQRRWDLDPGIVRAERTADPDGHLLGQPEGPEPTVRQWFASMRITRADIVEAVRDTDRWLLYVLALATLVGVGAAAVWTLT